MPILAWLLLLLVLSAASSVLVLRRGLPGLASLHRHGHPDVPAMTSSWLALAIALPAIVAGSLLGREGSAAGLAGVAAALPAAAGLVGLGVALTVGDGHDAAAGRAGDPAGPATDRLSRLLVAAAGLLLLVLVLERHLTVWTGQAAFALLAVGLWLGGPAKRPRGEDPARHLPDAVRRQELTCGLALAAAVALAIGEGLVLRAILLGAAAARDVAGSEPTTTVDVQETAGVALVAGRMMILTAASGLLPARLGRRAIGWTVALGLFGATGMAALVRLPGLLGSAARGEQLPGSVLAGGFGAWAGPTLCTLAVAAGLGMRPGGRVASVLGGAAVVAGIVAVIGSL